MVTASSSRTRMVSFRAARRHTGHPGQLLRVSLSVSHGPARLQIAFPFLGTTKASFHAFRRRQQATKSERRTRRSAPALPSARTPPPPAPAPTSSETGAYSRYPLPRQSAGDRPRAKRSCDFRLVHRRATDAPEAPGWMTHVWLRRPEKATEIRDGCEGCRTQGRGLCGSTIPGRPAG